jgi:hypothetical protein
VLTYRLVQANFN